MGEGQAWLELVSTCFVNAGFAIVCGSLASLRLLRGTESAWGRSRSRIPPVLARAVAATLLAFGLLLWAKAADIAEEPLMSAGRSIGTVLAQSHFGHAWLLGCAALLALCALRPVRLEHARWQVLATGCAVAFAASRSSMGHAGGSGELAPWFIDAVHLLSTSLWAGAVILAGVTVLSVRGPVTAEDRRDCADYVQALSTMATWSLTVVLLTGIAGAWRLVGGATDDLMQSRYGAVLIAKLLLVAVAAALGAFNRVRLSLTLRELRVPEPASVTHLEAFRRVLQVESGVLIAVLMFAALLGASVPPVAK